MTGEPVPLRDVAIIGGGCYGTFYARQLLAARERGAAAFARILLVDQDPACQAAREGLPASGAELVTASWDGFLAGFLEAVAPDDAVVPSPLMPHLMAHWLRDLALRRWPRRPAALVAPDLPLGTPYDSLGPDGNRYVSFADWICPTHCIEPLTCPVIRAPRTWEIGEALAVYTDRLGRLRPTAGPALFTTRHHAYGVGMIGGAGIAASRALLEAAGETGAPVDLVIGTVSACHGAVSVLRLGAVGA